MLCDLISLSITVHRRPSLSINVHHWPSPSITVHHRPSLPNDLVKEKHMEEQIRENFKRISCKYNALEKSNELVLDFVNSSLRGARPTYSVVLPTSVERE